MPKPRKEELPYIEWSAEDWRRDTAGLTPATRGIWLSIILHLHPRSGRDTLPVRRWVSIAEATPDETISAIAELISRGICDYSFPVANRIDGFKDVELTSYWSSELRRNIDCVLTLICRRIDKDSKSREAHRLSMRSWKENKDIDADLDVELTEKRPNNGNPLSSKNKSNTKISAPSSSGNNHIENDNDVGHSRKRGTSEAPDLFEITEKCKIWAKENKIEGIEAETAKFLDYHRAKGSKFKNWESAWRYWMRNAKAFARGTVLRSPAPGSRVGENTITMEDYEGI
jgi:hypothetical protein